MANFSSATRQRLARKGITLHHKLEGANWTVRLPNGILCPFNKRANAEYFMLAREMFPNPS